MLHAVKIVTFLTMPVEPSSRDYSAQVPCKSISPFRRHLFAVSSAVRS